jgi:hypothetical protein
MKARALMASAVFDPPTLQAIQKAFDDAWEVVSPQVSNRAEAIEAARLRLADIVLRLARSGTLDARTITEAAAQLVLADESKSRPVF